MAATARERAGALGGDEPHPPPTPPSPTHPALFTQLRALDKKANKFEKIKNEKCGSVVWSEVSELAALIR